MPGLSTNSFTTIERVAEGKKLHDLVAALCALDPARSGCTFRRVRLAWVPTRPQQTSQRKDGALGGTRHKGGGEWGCLFAASDPVRLAPGGAIAADDGAVHPDTVMPGEGRKLLAKCPEMRPNAWVAVDIDIAAFRDGLVAS